MKVWIVNPFDNLPAEGSRPMRYFLMASAFSRAGHDVTYWTADFSHTAKSERRIPDDRPAECGARIAFRLVHEPPYFSNVSLRRLLAHRRWAKNWRSAAAEAAPPDLIVVSTPPLAIGREAGRYAAKTGAKVIVDIMDDWPGTFRRVAPGFALWPLARLARRNILSAAAVTVVADRYADLARSYGFKGETRRFYHGIELPPTVEPSPSKTTRLVYIGSLGRTYDLRTVVEALALLPGATLDVAGDGEQAEELRSVSDRVRFHGHLADGELRKLLSNCDIGIVPMSRESCVGVPYKLADYSAAGLAVASSLGGESGRLLARYDAGVAYRAGDPQSLAASIKSIGPRLATLRANSRRMAEAEFDAAAIYSDYVAFAMSLFSANHQPQAADHRDEP